MKLSAATIIAITVSVLRLSVCQAEILEDKKKDPHVIEAFRFNQDALQVCLPVTIDNKTYPFVLGTGSSCCIYDARLKEHMGPAVGEMVAANHASPQPLTCKKHVAPKISVGSIRLPQREFVPVFEYITSYAHADGIECFGVLGLDALRQSIVEVDFNEGIVTFRDEVPPNPGTGIEMFSNKKSTEIYANVQCGIFSRNRDVPVVINTNMRGEMGFYGPFFDAIMENGKIRRGKRVFASPLTYTELRGELRTYSTGILDAVTIAGHTINDVRVTKDAAEYLGVGFLQRFKVVFDFPGKKLYLKPGARFAATPIDIGFGISWVKDNWTIYSVDERTPALAAGLQRHDVIKNVNGVDATWESQWKVRRILATSGREITMRIQRDGKDIEVKYQIPAQAPELIDKVAPK